MPNLPQPPIVPRFKQISDVDRGIDTLLIYLESMRRQIEEGLSRPSLPRFATADLPAAADVTWDTRVVIEDNGAGDQNLVLYSNGQRFRIDGGAAF